MKRIIITGSSGQLGRALNHLLADREEYDVRNTSTAGSEDGVIRALNITDEEAVDKAVSEYRPDIIINCTAMTAVDLCESEQEKAYRINALGPKNLAVAASVYGASLIHISTDYVFDGKSDRPYEESDMVNPLSVYGRTKLQGELLVKEYCERTFIIRTAWLYGEGKNFVRTMLRLAESGSLIRVVCDQFGTPTSALELARVILFLMETDDYGIYHATCEGSTNWYEFARTILRMAGIEVPVEPISTAEYPTAAQRPRYSVLENKALSERYGYYMKEWEQELKEYMDGMWRKG